jgi:hypothetical protein
MQTGEGRSEKGETRQEEQDSDWRRRRNKTGDKRRKIQNGEGWRGETEERWRRCRREKRRGKRMYKGDERRWEKVKRETEKGDADWRGREKDKGRMGEKGERRQKKGFADQQMMVWGEGGSRE